MRAETHSLLAGLISAKHTVEVQLLGTDAGLITSTVLLQAEPMLQACCLVYVYMICTQGNAST